MQSLKTTVVKAATLVAVKSSRIIETVFAVCNARKGQQIELLIVDDFYPGILSAFRIAEYNHYLEHLPSAEVHSTRSSNFFFRSKESFQEKMHEHSKYYPHLKGRIKKFNKRVKPNCKLLYTVFINNIYSVIDYVDKHRVPFVFTLYPGGGFHLNEPEADMKLARVFASPYFKKVFITQKITGEYLLEKGYCQAEDIVFIYGCVLPSLQLSGLLSNKRRFKVDKDSFDICFVAAKYTPRGVDKGFDVFIKVAKLLCERYGKINFHVVGSFDSSDIDVSSISDRITFYGLRPTDFFPGFYSGMDAILSPNVPFVLAPGAFDGFPTGSCMEAGLCGVAVFCSDPLQQNIAFEDRQEIVIIPRAAEEIAAIVERYHQVPEELYRLAENGQRAFSKALDLNVQMEVRMKVLGELLREPS